MKFEANVSYVKIFRYYVHLLRKNVFLLGRLESNLFIRQEVRTETNGETHQAFPRL